MNRPESDLEPWQWPEEHWRKLVARVRAGRTLRPRTIGLAVSYGIVQEGQDELHPFTPRRAV